jgi:signal transduction histidine kinase
LLPSGRPWRALVYLASGVPVGILVITALPLLLLIGLALTPLAVGVPLVLGAALIGVPVAAVERYRLRLIDSRPAPSPHRPVGRRGIRAWLATRLREAVTWQELAFAVLTAVVLWPLELLAVTFAVLVTGLTISAPFVVAIAPADAVPNGTRLYHQGLIWFLPPLGVLIAVAMAYLLVGLARIRSALVRAVVVTPSDQERLVELTRSRSRLVRGFDDERRRIERDLHDGVQQRLLALSVTLGLVRLELAEGDADTRDGTAQIGDADVPRGVAAHVVHAHEESKAILEQLRQLIRGIHPQILTDRGLPAAIDELAGRLTVHVHTDVALPGRFPDIVESTGYFMVSEALANVDRHSGADHAWVTGRYTAGTLTVGVRDDGRGGANPAGGTGLRGLADRAGAAGARLLVSSPPGGPTLLCLEIPCTPLG